MTRSKDFAFPTSNTTDVGPAAPGLTKREYFAALILSGIHASGVLRSASSNAAEAAVANADALLVELSKKDQ